MYNECIIECVTKENITYILILTDISVDNLWNLLKLIKFVLEHFAFLQQTERCDYYVMDLDEGAILRKISLIPNTVKKGNV